MKVTDEFYDKWHELDLDAFGSYVDIDNYEEDGILIDGHVSIEQLEFLIWYIKQLKNRIDETMYNMRQ